MKRTARRFVVREKTFGLVVEFYLGTPQQTAIRRCVALLQLDPSDPDNVPDDSDAAWAMCYGSQAVVWTEDAADTGSLVHELYHVVQDFLRHITSSDEETGAYLIQYLYREAMRRLNK
jgi:ERCC4-type nuclease